MHDQSNPSPESNFNYHRYLASREWAVLKERVRKRSGGVCERCNRNQATEVHHKTYERIGHERLSDLQHVCRACHEYESAKTGVDPARGGPMNERQWAEFVNDPLGYMFGGITRE